MADMKFGPEWLRALSDGNSVTSPPPSPGLVMPKYKLAEHRYGREEMLVLFTPSEKIPELLQEFPSIVSEKVLQPMSYISPSEEEQRLLSSSVNSSAVLRMMGGGGRGTAPPLRGRGVSVGPDRGRGRGRGRGDGGFYRDYDEDGFRSVRHGRGPSWGEEGRGFAPRGGFDEPITSPRREFSRSMSSENWREAKRTGGTETREEQDDGEGDWRRAGPRERWSRNWREPHDRGFDRDYPERGRYYDDFDRDRQRGFERPRTYSRSKSYDEEGDLPEWSTADADDIECLGTFDSSGAFMSMKEDGREESPRSEKGSDSNRKAGKSSPPKESESKINEAKAKKSPTESEDSAKAKIAPKRDSKKTEQAEANEAKMTEALPVNGDDVPTSAKSKTSSVNSSSSNSVKNKLQEEKKDSSVKKSAENKNAMARPDPQKSVSPVPEPGSGEQKKEVVDSKVKNKINMLAGRTAAIAIDNEKPADNVVQEQIGKTGLVTEPDEFDHLEKAAEDLMATWTAEEDEKSNRQAAVERGGVPINHEDAKRWFYKDPQGDLQGPFNSTEMAEWFSAGYFTMNLLVKRGCDDIFQPLGELIKRWGRVPFLNGPTPPPIKSTASTPTGSGSVPAAGIMPAAPTNTNAMPAAPMSVTPPVPAGPGVEQVMQQQFLLQQQQALLRQLQMQQLMQVLQQQEGFAKLTPAQQQQLCMQLFLKQQQHHLMQQQQAAAAAAAAGGGNPTTAMPQQPNAAAPQNLSPRSASVEPQPPVGGGQPVVSMAGPNSAGHPAFQRSVSQPGGEAPANWSSDTSPATSGNWTPQPASVWDIEPPKSQAQSFEEIQRIEIERQRRREAEEHEMHRRKEEEIMKQREDEMRRREEDERIKAEIERQKEMQRQEQIRREQEEVLRRRQEEESRRQREEEEARMREEEERRRQEQERRRQEEEMRRRQEEEIRRQQELQRQAEEERRRKEQEELERKRLDEIRRRQEKAEELKRQQAEAIRRMQQEQMADMQLPSHAQWANSSGANSINNGPTLAEIQKMEAEKAERDRLEEDQQKLMELQRQQLAAIQQQQQQQQRSWTAQKSMMSPQAGAPSLLEIQQEQARQLEEKHRQAQAQQQVVQQQKAKLPLGAAAAWGSVTSANWAQEGAWGNMQKQTAGFWDDAIGATGKKPTQNNNAGFPQLNTGGAAAPAAKPPKPKNVRTMKDQETVQRLFQETKPKDEFTQWCENSLKGLQTNIDVPTFIGFLQDVESPYEVHDYVRVYLGESKDATEFAKQFIERRSRYKNKMRQDQKEELIWGPAPAVNPLAKQQVPKPQAHHNNNGTESDAKKAAKKSKGKMQKIDASSLLGFTVHAGERVNMGEIDSIDG